MGEFGDDIDGPNNYAVLTDDGIGPVLHMGRWYRFDDTDRPDMQFLGAFRSISDDVGIVWFSDMNEDGPDGAVNLIARTTAPEFQAMTITEVMAC